MLRIADLSAALEARGYAPQLQADLHLEVTDPLVPENSGPWQLTVRGGRGVVRRGGEGRLRLDIGVLAALYTGYGRPELLSAGRPHGRAGSRPYAGRPRVRRPATIHGRRVLAAGRRHSGRAGQRAELEHGLAFTCGRLDGILVELLLGRGTGGPTRTARSYVPSDRSRRAFTLSAKNVLRIAISRFLSAGSWTGNIISSRRSRLRDIQSALPM